jgi:hypothetical protein
MVTFPIICKVRDSGIVVIRPRLTSLYGSIRVTVV